MKRASTPTARARVPSPTGRALADGLIIEALQRAAARHGSARRAVEFSASGQRANLDTPREVCEAALAHANRDRVEAAYQRSDLLDRRRDLMNAWSRYLAAERATVVELRA